MKIGIGVQRLFLFTFFFLVFCHMVCCLWVMVADYQGMVGTWMDSLYQTASNYEIYVSSIYYAITTITTVGYGDISGNTSNEKLFCIVAMITGVLSFSFISGSLSSILQNSDSANSYYEEKLQYLNYLTRKFQISDDLYQRLKGSFKYNFIKDAEEMNNLLNELPFKLKMELTYY